MDDQKQVEKCIIKKKIIILCTMRFSRTLCQSQRQVTMISTNIPKETVAKLHMFLSVLPLPPLPMRFCVDISKIKERDIKVAAQTAMSALEGEAKSLETIHNSHSIIAAFFLMSDWTGYHKVNKERIDVEKEGVILKLMTETVKNSDSKGNLTCDSDRAYEIFYDASVSWIKTYFPPEISATFEPVSADGVKFESKVHISMSHYAYSQGVLYSNRKNKVCCEVHNQKLDEFNRKRQVAREDKNSLEARQMDDESVQRESMEVAELYSKHDYPSLIFLCLQRIQKDTLYGHEKNITKETAVEIAADLMDQAQKNYDKTLSNISKKEDEDLQNKKTSESIDTDASNNSEPGEETEKSVQESDTHNSVNNSSDRIEILDDDSTDEARLKIVEQDLADEARLKISEQDSEAEKDIEIITREMKKMSTASNVSDVQACFNVRMFYSIFEKFLTMQDVSVWNAVALNVEHYKTLKSIDDENIQKSCHILKIDDLFKLISKRCADVNFEQEENNMLLSLATRINDAMSDLSDMSENVNSAVGMSFRSELGILITTSAQSFADVEFSNKQTLFNFYLEQILSFECDEMCSEKISEIKSVFNSNLFQPCQNVYD